jgi:hypothetical protein
MGQKETAMNGKNRIMAYGPKDDGTSAVEFRTPEGDVLAISIQTGVGISRNGCRMACSCPMRLNTAPNYATPFHIR